MELKFAPNAILSIQLRGSGFYTAAGQVEKFRKKYDIPINGQSALYILPIPFVLAPMAGVTDPALSSTGERASVVLLSTRR